MIYKVKVLLHFAAALFLCNSCAITVNLPLVGKEDHEVVDEV